MDRKCREAIHDQPEREDDEGSACRLRKNLTARRALSEATADGEDTRNSYHEQKAREHNVRQRAAIPARVHQKAVGVRAVSAGVHHNHDGNGEAPEHVQRLKARRSFGCTGQGTGTGRFHHRYLLA